jgi:hypothetical protein
MFDHRDNAISGSVAIRVFGSSIVLQRNRFVFSRKSTRHWSASQPLVARLQHQENSMVIFAWGQIAFAARQDVVSDCRHTG